MSFRTIGRVMAVALVGVLAIGARGQEKSQAFVGARVLPISGAEIEHGIVVVQNGKILAVGAEGSTAIPAGAERHDVTGKVIMPGIVDTHSHIGGVGGADGSSPI